MDDPKWKKLLKKQYNERYTYLINRKIFTPVITPNRDIMNDEITLSLLRRSLKIWKMERDYDDNRILEWFTDINNDGGVLPESNISLDIVLSKLEKILKED